MGPFQMMVCAPSRASRVQLGTGRSNVQYHEIPGDFLNRDDLYGSLDVQFFTDNGIHGHVERLSRLSGLFHQFRGLDIISSSTREWPVANPWALKKRIGHGSADDYFVHVPEQNFEKRQFIGHFYSADEGDEGTRRMLHGSMEVIQLSLHQQPGRFFLEETCHSGDEAWARWDTPKASFTIRRNPWPVGGRTPDRHWFHRMEAEILEEHYVSRLHGGKHGLCFRTDAVRSQDYRASQEFAQALGHGFKAEFGIGFSFGPSGMGSQDQGSTLLQAYSSVGKTMRILLSSVMCLCPSRGTLKSARTKTFFPFNSI